jgi:hypothetical protein
LCNTDLRFFATPATRSGTAASRTPTTAPPPIVREEQQLLDVVLRKLDGGTRKTRIQVDDASALIELRDALAEAKPEDQGRSWSRCTGSRRCPSSAARATRRPSIASRPTSATCAWKKAASAATC